MADTPTLELRGVSKSFGSVQALTDVDFEVRDGEVMALVGDNGAGKSTLIKSVAGIHPFDGGEVLFDGQPVSIHGPKDAARLGIEVVYQDLALCDNLDVVQNMYLARAVMWNSRVVILDEPTAALGVAQTQQVLELVKRLGEQGLAVVLISHNLHDVFEVANRITVLRLGRDVGVYERDQTTPEEVVEAITLGTTDPEQVHEL